MAQAYNLAIYGVASAGIGFTAGAFYGSFATAGRIKAAQTGARFVGLSKGAIFVSTVAKIEGGTAKAIIGATKIGFRTGAAGSKLGLRTTITTAGFLGRSTPSLLGGGLKLTVGIAKSPIGRVIGFAGKKVLLPFALVSGGIGAFQGAKTSGLRGGVIGGISGFTGIPTGIIDKSFIGLSAIRTFF